MCSKTTAPKTKKNTVPVVSRPVFKKAPKFPPGIKICEVLKLTAELSSMTIPQTTSIPQYPPGTMIMPAFLGLLKRQYRSYFLNTVIAFASAQFFIVGTSI